MSEKRSAEKVVRETNRKNGPFSPPPRDGGEGEDTVVHSESSDARIVRITPLGWNKREGQAAVGGVCSYRLSFWHTTLSGAHGPQYSECRHFADFYFNGDLAPRTWAITKHLSRVSTSSCLFAVSQSITSLGNIAEDSESTRLLAWLSIRAAVLRARNPASGASMVQSPICLPATPIVRPSALNAMSSIGVLCPPK